MRVLINWSSLHDIDLELRFAQRKFLTEQELESLRSHMQEKVADPMIQNAKVVPLRRGIEGARSKIQESNNRVSSSTQYIRMSYVASYLEWLAIRLVERDARQVDENILKRIKLLTKRFSTLRHT